MPVSVYTPRNLTTGVDLAGPKCKFSDLCRDGRLSEGKHKGLQDFRPDSTARLVAHLTLHVPNLTWLRGDLRRHGNYTDKRLPTL